MQARPARLLLPGRRGHARRCCSATTRPTWSRCSARPRTRPKYTKDGINNRVVHGDTKAVNPALSGTKVAFWYDLGLIEPGETAEVRLRLSQTAPDKTTFGADFDAVFDDRKREADEFYATVIHPALSDEDRHIARRAYAGLLWGKQLYRYNVDEWIEGDPTESPAPDARKGSPARNAALGAAGPRRRHLDAGRMGIPLVRGLGPGVSRDPAGARRPGFRQGTTGADVPGMVDAPERPIARLRMGIR